MIINAQQLIDEFKQDYLSKTGISIQIEHELLPAPHQPSKLPTGHAAVYVFSLSPHTNAPIGANTVLKVGMVGQNSNSRFQTHHYKSTHANSTLSKSLLDNPDLWPALGIVQLDKACTRAWLLENTERDHFFVIGSESREQEDIETYLLSKLKPVFEGGRVHL